MTQEEIKNLDLPKEVWEELKKNAEASLRNSKISYYQFSNLLDLANSKISEFKTDDDKDADESLKDLIKEVVA